MKKIFFLNSYPEWGGGEKWTFEVAKELNSQKDYKVIVGSIESSGLFQRSKQAGIETKIVNVNSSLSVLNPFKLLFFVNYLKKKKIDILLLNLSQDLKFGAIAGKLAGVKKIIYRRGSAIPIKNRFYTKYLLEDCVTDIIANSISTKETILQNTRQWINENKIRIIYNGIQLDEVEMQLKIYKKRDLREEFGIDKDTLLIANVGRLTRQKGHKYLLEAITLLKEEIDNFRVLIVGEGELEEEIKNKIKELNIENYVILAGFRTDIYHIMNEVDLVLHTALWEGFGYVVAEAMAVGTPVISTNVSNIAEIMVDEETGYLASSKDPADITEKVLKFLSSGNKDKMGSLGKSIICDKFTFKYMIEQLIKIF